MVNMIILLAKYGLGKNQAHLVETSIPGMPLHTHYFGHLSTADV